MNFFNDNETADLKENVQVKFGESISQSAHAALCSEVKKYK